MATEFLFSIDGRPLVRVPRKFLLKDNELNFVEISEHAGRTVRRARNIPASPFELDCFPYLQDNFDLASQECDALKLQITVPSHPDLKTIEDLRNFANIGGSEMKGKNKRYDEVSSRLLGQNYSPLLDSLRKKVVGRFLQVFPKVQLGHPVYTSPERKFIFGPELYAPDEVRNEIFALALQGHTYSQFIAALLDSTDRPVTQFTAEMLVAAHCSGMPKALAALGERLCADTLYEDALNCAVLAVDGGFDEAMEVINKVVRATTNRLLELQEGGYIGLMDWLVRFALAPEIRELLYKHKPDWRPLTHEQQLERFLTSRLMKGGSHD